MDLLAGYGSDADSEPEEAQEVAPQRFHEAIMPGAGALAVPSSAPAAPGDPSPANLLSRLPAPSSIATPMFSGLPKPKPAAKKVVVQFRVPITYGDAPVLPDDEEAPAKKKHKASTRGLTLAEVLPPPRNEGRVGMRLDALAAAAGSGRREKYASDDDDIVPGTEDRTGMELGAGDPNEPEDNEAYRVQPTGAAAAVAAAAGPSGAAAAAAAAAQQQQLQRVYGGDTWGQYYEQQGQQYDSSFGYGTQQHGGAAAAAAGADLGQELLDAALEAERQKAVRRGELDPLAAAGVQFKEVKADAIRYMDPSQRATISAVRTALGSDYEARLRAEAGPAGGNKLARRKHQIGSLYAHAKAKELEDFERKAAGMKSKAETQSKYGW